VPFDLDLLTAAGSALSYGEGPSVPWARILLAFLLCAGLAAAAIAFIRWRTRPGGPGPFWQQMTRGAREGRRELELVERLALSPTTHLFVVRWGQRRLLILSSSSGAQVLRENDDSPASEKAG
jgi:hypothetical protein